jgi:hypothetical protein
LAGSTSEENQTGLLLAALGRSHPGISINLGNSVAFCMTVSRKRLQTLVLHKVVMNSLHTI